VVRHRTRIVQATNMTVNSNHTTIGGVFINNGQETYDENHGGPPKSGSGDVGGLFLSRKGTLESSALGPYNLGNGPFYYQGPIAANWDSVSFPNGFEFPDYSSSTLLATRGATAISRCAPTNPHAQAAVMIGELLHDGMPEASSSLFRNHSKESLAEDYLNVEFGWKPLVSDLEQVVKSVRKSQEILKQYHRDAGRLVRRRYDFPAEISSSTVTSSTYARGPNIWLIDPGVCTKTTINSKETWFSGAFTYTAMAASDMNQIERAGEYCDQILGIELNPQVIWDLAPWSWAVDWVTNAGDIMNNVSMMAQDGLVLHHGYIMEHSVREIDVIWTGNIHYPAQSIILGQQMISEVKQRYGASPFGFGLLNSAFSAKQVAIMAALGLTHSAKYRGL
jgi:hypothetical protein